MIAACGILFVQEIKSFMKNVYLSGQFIEVCLKRG